MKLRLTVLSLVLLVLMGFLATAAMAETAAAPEVPSALAVGSPLTPAVSSPGCAEATLPIFAPAPTDRILTNCGTCSDTICRGQPLHANCGFKNGQTYKCQAVLGNTCGAGTGTWQCTCWTGPLP